jgi:hypothetical protein
MSRQFSFFIDETDLDGKEYNSSRSSEFIPNGGYSDATDATSTATYTENARMSIDDAKRVQNNALPDPGSIDVPNPASYYGGAGSFDFQMSSSPVMQGLAVGAALPEVTAGALTEAGINSSVAGAMGAGAGIATGQYLTTGNVNVTDVGGTAALYSFMPGGGIVKSIVTNTASSSIGAAFQYNLGQQGSLNQNFVAPFGGKSFGDFTKQAIIGDITGIASDKAGSSLGLANSSNAGTNFVLNFATNASATAASEAAQNSILGSSNSTSSNGNAVNAIMGTTANNSGNSGAASVIPSGGTQPYESISNNH